MADVDPTLGQQMIFIRDWNIPLGVVFLPQPQDARRRQIASGGDCYNRWRANSLTSLKHYMRL